MNEKKSFIFWLQNSFQTKCNFHDKSLRWARIDKETGKDKKLFILQTPDVANQERVSQQQTKVHYFTVEIIGLSVMMMLASERQTDATMHLKETCSETRKHLHQFDNTCCKKSVYQSSCSVWIHCSSNISGVIAKDQSNGNYIKTCWCKICLCHIFEEQSDNQPLFL